MLKILSATTAEKQKRSKPSFNFPKKEEEGERDGNEWSEISGTALFKNVRWLLWSVIWGEPEAPRAAENKLVCFFCIFIFMSFCAILSSVQGKGSAIKCAAKDERTIVRTVISTGLRSVCWLVSQQDYTKTLIRWTLTFSCLADSTWLS